MTAAFASFEDPNKSAVAGKLETVPLPSGRGGARGAVIGNWNAVVPKNAPDAQKKAALAFSRWFLTYDAQRAFAQAGGIPNRSDVFTSDLTKEPRLRWMPAYLETQKFAQQELGYAEGAQVEQILGLRLKQALIGEMSSGKALNTAAKEIEDCSARTAGAPERCRRCPNNGKWGRSCFPPGNGVGVVFPNRAERMPNARQRKNNSDPISTSTSGISDAP